MDKEISFQIDNILNIFTSNNIKEILNKYHIDNYYELTQIHSTITHIVNDNYQNNSFGDALITNKINTPLVIKTADCCGILLYDKRKQVIATIHSGWKGTLNNITKNTVKLMIKEFNSNPQDIYAHLYPSIRSCHFEVEYDVYSKFKNNIKDIDKYVNQKDIKYYIDLQSIIKDNLKELGITNITDSNICTFCHNNIFHSYRYNHTNKRNILIAMIKEQI